MNINATGMELIIITFLSFDNPTKDLGYKNQTHTRCKTVNCIKKRHLFPWEMAMPVKKKKGGQINDKKDTKSYVKIVSKFFLCFRSVQKI